MVGNRSTLCWKCQNTNADKCSWFNKNNPQPVKGWNAIRRDVKVQTTSHGKLRIRLDPSYCVLDCPNFEPTVCKRDHLTCSARAKEQSI